MKTVVKGSVVSRRVEAFIVLMNRLERMHGELHEVLVQKLEAIRGARIGDMQKWSSREREIIEAIVEQDGLRKQLSTQIGRDVGTGDTESKVFTVRHLANAMGEPFRTRLLSASVSLRKSVESVRKVNEFVGRVSVQVMTHMRDVFESMADPAAESDAYDPRGSVAVGQSRELFEAIG
jgi:flagellar FlgN protein